MTTKFHCECYARTPGRVMNDDAKKNNENIRQLDRDGCVIIKVGDRDLRKDRLDKISASLKARRKKRQPHGEPYVVE